MRGLLQQRVPSAAWDPKVQADLAGPGAAGRRTRGARRRAQSAGLEPCWRFGRGGTDVVVCLHGSGEQEALGALQGKEARPQPSVEVSWRVESRAARALAAAGLSARRWCFSRADEVLRAVERAGRAVIGAAPKGAGWLSGRRASAELARPVASRGLSHGLPTARSASLEPGGCGEAPPRCWVREERVHVIDKLPMR